MRQETIERLQVKTAEQRFPSVLESEFREAPRVAEAILAETRTRLLGAVRHLHPGQMRASTDA